MSTEEIKYMQAYNFYLLIKEEVTIKEVFLEIYKILNTYQSRVNLALFNDEVPAIWFSSMSKKELEDIQAHHTSNTWGEVVEVEEFELSVDEYNRRRGDTVISVSV